jgi:hypothetical protein
MPALLLRVESGDDLSYAAVELWACNNVMDEHSGANIDLRKRRYCRHRTDVLLVNNLGSKPLPVVTCSRTPAVVLPSQCVQQQLW